MTDQIVLVAYASKYGATAEIARRIGETLAQEGWQVKVLPADQVPDLAIYKGTSCL
jgi:menaquinone-dependent protoporphyrinogen oxidase